NFFHKRCTIRFVEEFLLFFTNFTITFAISTSKVDSKKKLCSSDLQKIHDKFCFYSKKKSICLTESKNTIFSKIESYIKKKKKNEGLITSGSVLSNGNFYRFVYEMSVYGGYGFLESFKILGYYKLFAFYLMMSNRNKFNKSLIENHFMLT
uniref:Uncharacterized protein n=1 Tax=Strongyloides stercoralis TaxID=6248 RepID=A0AAF5DRT4_STRER